MIISVCSQDFSEWGNPDIAPVSREGSQPEEVRNIKITPVSFSDSADEISSYAKSICEKITETGARNVIVKADRIFAYYLAKGLISKKIAVYTPVYVLDGGEYKLLKYRRLTEYNAGGSKLRRTPEKVANPNAFVFAPSKRIIDKDFLESLVKEQFKDTTGVMVFGAPSIFPTLSREDIEELVFKNVLFAESNIGRHIAANDVFIVDGDVSYILLFASFVKKVYGSDIYFPSFRKEADDRRVFDSACCIRKG